MVLVMPPPGDEAGADGSGVLSPLPARLLEQLLVLLLPHRLTALLDDGRQARILSRRWCSPQSLEDRRRPWLPSSTQGSVGAEQVPQVHPADPIALVQSNRTQLEGLRPLGHRREEAQDVLLGRVLEVSEPRALALPVGQTHQDAVEAPLL